MAAERDDHGLVLRVVVLLDVAGERQAARKAMRALRHRRARRIETGDRQGVELAEQIGNRPRDQLLLELVLAQSRGIAGALLQPVGPAPAIVRRAIGAIGKRAHVVAVGDGPVGIEISIGRGVRDHIGDRNAQGVVNLVRHFVTRHELAAGRVAGEHDGLEIGKHVLARELAQDLVRHVVGGNCIVDGGRAGAPVVARARPIDLVRCKRVLAISSVVGGVRGDTMMVSSSAFARKPAATAERK